jgi:hypothetical protein
VIELPSPTFDAPRKRPRVSLVVAWQGSLNELLRRLTNWEHWVEQGIDVVLACRWDADDRFLIARSCPGIRIVAASEDADVATLRHLGVSLAKGDIVVIVDDMIAWESSWRDQFPAVFRADVLDGHRARWADYTPSLPSIGTGRSSEPA